MSIEITEFKKKPVVKTILLIGAGKDQIPMIEAARELNLKVFGFDGNPEADGLKLLDGYEIFNIKNLDLIEQYAKKFNKKYGIDGVISPAVEVGPSVGRIVDKLGLLGIGEKTALNLTDKILRRQLFDSIGIPQPKWAYREEKREKLWNFFPCVVKPRNEAGARGVRLVKNFDEFGLNWDYVEEYLEGWELSTEVLIFKDNSFLFISADRNYDKKLKYQPYLLEDGCQVPSKIPENITKKIENIIIKIIRHLNLSSCALKFDLLVKDNVVYVIECAPRLGGGKLSSVMIPRALGIPWWKLALVLAMGINQREIDWENQQLFAAQRYLFPPTPKSHHDRITDYIETAETYEEAVRKAEAKVATHKQ